MPCLSCSVLLFIAGSFLPHSAAFKPTSLSRFTRFHSSISTRPRALATPGHAQQAVDPINAAQMTFEMRGHEMLMAGSREYCEPLQMQGGVNATAVDYLQLHFDRVIVACWDKDHTQRLPENGFRLSLSTIPLLPGVTVQPSVDIAVKFLEGVLHVTSITWCMKGVESLMSPDRFKLSVQGRIWCEAAQQREEEQQQQPASNLKAEVKYSLAWDVPTILHYVPHSVIEGVCNYVNNRLLNSVARRFKGVPQDYRYWAHKEQGQPLPNLDLAPSTAIQASGKPMVAPLVAWFKAFMKSGLKAVLWLAAVWRKLLRFPKKLINPPPGRQQYGA